MKFRRTGGPVDVPAVGEVDIKTGDVIEATGDVAKSLEKQSDTWERVDTPKKES